MQFFSEDYLPFCRVCGLESLSLHSLIEKPVSRAGIFYFCNACDALSFHAAKNANSYSPEYYGCGDSKVGGVAKWIRSLSAKWRADFASKLVRRGQCLDIGCGDGEFLKAMLHRGWIVKGTELPGPAYERAQQKFPCQIRCTAQYETAVDPLSCSMITLWQVFEHLESPLHVLENCSKLLIAGGVLGIGVPNPASWQALWGKGHWLHFDPPRHLHLQKVESLVKLAEGVGFKCIAIRYPWIEFGPIGWIQTILNRLGFSRDYFFERMKDRWSGVSTLRKVGLTALAALSAPPAFLLAFLEASAKSSATYEVYFRFESQRMK